MTKLTEIKQTPADMLEIRDLPPQMEQSPAGLYSIPGGWTERDWILEGRLFRLILPATPDSFLEDPEVHAAFDRDEYMPYWAYVWPAALKMAATILRADWPANAHVLELGAGIGIVGLAGLAKGLNVILSDYEPKAVELALHNARRNGFEQGEGLVLDWRDPPSRQFPFLWGCELLYEDRHHEPLLKLTSQILAPGGVGWFGDGGRMRAERFCQMAPDYDLEVQLFDERLQRIDAPRVGRYQLIEIRHRQQ